jgi:hypothetical protein
LDNRFIIKEKNQINNSNQLELERDNCNDKNFKKKDKMDNLENMNIKYITFKEAYNEIQNGFNLENQNQYQDFSSKNYILNIKYHIKLINIQ